MLSPLILLHRIASHHIACIHVHNESNLWNIELTGRVDDVLV